MSTDSLEHEQDDDTEATGENNTDNRPEQSATEHFVDDREGKLHQERINAILEARQTVPQKRREANELHHFDEIDAFTRDTIIRNAVEDYITELEHLIRDTDTQRPYWSGVRYETDNPTEDDKPEDTVFLGEMLLPDGTTQAFYGLQSILDCPNPIIVEWTEREDGHTGSSQTTHREVDQITRDILMQSYRTVNAFCFEIGIDLDVKKDTGDAGFDYSDVLEDGPPDEDFNREPRGDE